MNDAQISESSSPDSEEASAEAFLRQVGRTQDQTIDIIGAALALATFDASVDSVDAHRRHLKDMIRDLGVASRSADTTQTRLAALNHVVFGLHGYAGDAETYDDLQNANLIRVIDRRKGLPVALGIIMIHLARSQKWEICGIDFPGHFLLRLEGPDARLIIDPFHQGAVLDAPALRALLKAVSGRDAELEARHYEAIGDIDVLLRLQNNIKLRLIQAQRSEEACGIVDTMLMLRPEDPRLWRESGLLNAHIGRVRTALAALQTYITAETNPAPRAEAEAIVKELRSSLN